MLYLMIFISCFFTQDSDEQKLLGDWELKHYEAIHKIKASSRYQMGDQKTRSALDKQFDEIMKNGGYSFTRDTLDFAELEGTQVRYRVGLWRMKDQTLYITEINRPVTRRVFIHYLSSDSLVLSPVTENSVGEPKMVFKKNRDSISRN
jgi:hypothetical protein